MVKTKVDDRRLTLIWEDNMRENGGEETLNNIKKEYSSCSVEELLVLVESLLELETENKPTRYKIYIGDYLNTEEYTVVYSEREIDYKELLVSLVCLMMLLNIEDRPSLIVNLAHCIREIDKKTSERFAKDIAEYVYRKYR
ncbi:hypothetical protein GI482_09035 [Bacillus sp. N3536]|nr:hypothetical protein GI482_09035 [Bacillus sp. N3536]